MSEHVLCPGLESVTAHLAVPRRLRRRRRRRSAIAVWVHNDRTSSTSDHISVRSHVRTCPVDRSLWRGRSLDRWTVWIDHDRTTIHGRRTLWCRSGTAATAATAAASANDPATVWAVAIRRDRFAVRTRRKLARSGRPSNRNRPRGSNPKTGRPAPFLGQRTEYRIPPRRHQGSVGPGLADEMSIPDVLLQRTAGGAECGNV